MKKKVLLSCCTALLIIIAIWVYREWFGTTKIAFVNYQTLTMGSIAKSNDNPKIKILDVSTDELRRLTSVDMIFINGMGLSIVEEERAFIQKLADDGIPVYTAMATNPSNNISNLDSLNYDNIKAYLVGGGRRNYQYLLNYIRKVIDEKRSSVADINEPIERAFDILYHAGIEDTDDVVESITVAEYEKFLRDNKLYKEGAQRIVVTGQMADATALIASLETQGYNVYPISSIAKVLSFMEEINPDAVINMAHGRLGDKVVDFLKERNILLFAPLTVNSLVEDWEKDPMGLSGGFLSQSVVTPEIDGAIRSYALFAQYEDEDGLRHSYAIPERLNSFVSNVNKHLTLKKKDNSEKRVAIYYLKGPGQSAMTAAGMEVAPSLYNLLSSLKIEGYNLSGLPATSDKLEEMIMEQGAVLGAYAKGAFDEFMENGNPELVDKATYETWVLKSLRPHKYAEVVSDFGEFPGDYMATENGEIGVARIQFGNVVILPQNAAGVGSNSFQIVHGTDKAPPHPYIASYLWTQHGFKADALIHFGTHGSLEFTPGKQIALCSDDWSDRLVGELPHFYVYTIGNVGEGMIAKRRSYATLQTHLTPPFLESNVRGMYRDLMDEIRDYNKILGEFDGGDSAKLEKASLDVKKLALKLGVHRDLGLDSIAGQPYTEDQILKLENFAEELATEKITGQLYTLGEAYEAERIISSVYAMSTEPIAYSLLALDKQRGKAGADVQKRKAIFTRLYLNPAKVLVKKQLNNPVKISDKQICQIAGITADELVKAREIEKSRNAPKGMMAMMMAMQNGGRPESSMKKQGGMMSSMMKKMAGGMNPEQIEKAAKAMGVDSIALKKMMAKIKEKENSKDGKPTSMGGMMGMGGMKQKEYTREEINFAIAVGEVERTIKNISNYKHQLEISPDKEIQSIMNSLNAGYTAPSSGGDPIINPNTLPTGRNMFSINAEETPTEDAWAKGVELAKNTIDLYQKRHDGAYPKKVSYTFWGGEFIQTKGASIAQVLYMLGVEPIRDAFGRVSDLRLIPSGELGRPRIDIIVQTSGQVRDLAASRLFLINRAVEMAASAKDDEYENRVQTGIVESERVLVEKGVSPKEAREIASFRVFGGANGMYGTGIQGMVESGDRWEDESEIAAAYINNMGAYYGSEKSWESYQKFAFEAALTRTDVVIQPRQSNTWGALSLDHVYEFMGGLNLAVRNVTGKDPDAYFSDYRNRNNNKIQELKESIGVESRTTIFNPTYIKEKMKGEATSAGVFAETIRNTYSWNVMKPNVIDDELWDEVYNVYVKDKFNLNVQDFFEKENPAALEEITAVMLETVRKGMWDASEQQIADIVKLHTELVEKYEASCTGFVCDNAKLRDYIAEKASPESAKSYKKSIAKVRESVSENKNDGVVMKKEELNKQTNQEQTKIESLWIGIAALIAFVGLIFLVRRRRKNQN